MRQLAYQSMIQTRMTYMIEIWGSASTSRWSSVQKIQNRALRNARNLPYLTPRLDIYLQHCPEILPIKALYDYSTARFVFKRLNDLLMSDLVFSSASHSYDSRHRGLLLKPRCSSEFTKARVSYAGPNIYNQLPMSLRETLNIRQFSAEVFKFIQTNGRFERYLSY